jgi:hypothetical protein
MITEKGKGEKRGKLFQSINFKNPLEKCNQKVYNILNR